jgi:hypothetical protein
MMVDSDLAAEKRQSALDDGGTVPAHTR